MNAARQRRDRTSTDTVELGDRVVERFVVENSPCPRGMPRFLWREALVDVWDTDRYFAAIEREEVES